MPELPEVETVVRTLERMIGGRTVTNVTVRYPKIIEGDPAEFEQQLKNQTFREFERRGKYLIFRMTDCTLVCHLRMEGKFYVMDPSAPLTRPMHVLFDLDDGSQLRSNDTRKFGRMEIFPLDTDFSRFRNLGPEPFDETYTGAYVKAYARSRNTPLKTMLLDQSFTAGIGNIYADEILFASHLRPGRNCHRITNADAAAIADNTRTILHRAILAGGTTIRSYTSSLGVTGLFQNDCMVHEQKICRICGSTIKMKRIGGRSSYYCPQCQKDSV